MFRSLTFTAIFACLLLPVALFSQQEQQALNAGLLVEDVTSSLPAGITNIVGIRGRGDTAAILVSQDSKHSLLVWRKSTKEVIATVSQSGLDGGVLVNPDSRPDYNNLYNYSSCFSVGKSAVYFTSLKQGIDPEAPSQFQSATIWRLADFTRLEKVLTVGDNITISGTSSSPAVSGRVALVSTIFANPVGKEFTLITLEQGGSRTYVLSEIRNGAFYALTNTPKYPRVTSAGIGRFEWPLTFFGDNNLVFGSGTAFPGYVTKLDLADNQTTPIVMGGIYNPFFGRHLSFFLFSMFQDYVTATPYYVYGTDEIPSTGPWLEGVTEYTGTWDKIFDLDSPIEGLPRPVAVTSIAVGDTIKLVGLYYTGAPSPYQRLYYIPDAIAAWDKQKGVWTSLVKEGDTMPGGKRIEELGSSFAAFSGGEGLFFTIKGGRNGNFDALYHLSPAPPPVKPAVINALVTSSLQNAENRRIFSPGELVTAFGNDLTGFVTAIPTPLNMSPGPSADTGTVNLLRTLASCNVLLDGAQIPLYFAWTGPAGNSQINFQIPPATSLGNHQLVIQRLKFGTSVVDASSEPITIQVVPTTHWFFGDYDMNGIGPFMQNWTRDPSGATFVSFVSPARGGDILILWPTGLGKTTPLLPPGQGSGYGSLSWVDAKVEVWLRDPDPAKDYWWRPEEIMVVYPPVANPSFAGLYQLAIRIPAGVSPGKGRLVVRIAGVDNGFDIPLQ